MGKNLVHQEIQYMVVINTKGWVSSGLPKISFKKKIIKNIT
jgi:hypothetical protein